MPPPVILSPSSLDFSSLVADREAIMKLNPQRFEFQLLDGVLLADREKNVFAGFHDVRADAFWVRGHIPGRPLFPGVLMIESAAQLCSFMFYAHFPGSGFLGFAGVDGVKFRGAVVPPRRLVIVGQVKSVRPRRMICNTQGYVDENMVFEAEITGMPV